MLTLKIRSMGKSTRDNQHEKQQNGKKNGSGVGAQFDSTEDPIPASHNPENEYQEQSPAKMSAEASENDIPDQIITKSPL